MAARHVVVDGSNLATEGRSMPSLAQLDQAVREFLLENPEDVVTVVVDASFGHRIDSGEFKVFEEAEAAGELVSPPAGAIGRGDAFLLRIADKTGATVLSNDSFQEFHGDYDWLFERGRLIGGKPVPGVGWIFTPRTPVRGPRSREAVKEAKRKTKGETESAVPGLDLAAERSRTKGKGKGKVERAIAVALEEVVAPNDKPRRRRKGGSPPADPVNDPLSFITFIAAHPLGGEVTCTVDSFASHGAFVDCGGARCYVPLSAMGEPPPKSAREIFSKGEQVRFVVQALDPQRRGVELALPGFAKIAGAPTEETVAAEIEARADGDGSRAADAAAGPDAPAGPARRSRKKAAPVNGAAEPAAPEPVAPEPVAKSRAPRRRATKAAAAEVGESAPSQLSTATAADADVGPPAARKGRPRAAAPQKRRGDAAPAAPPAPAPAPAVRRRAPRSGAGASAEAVPAVGAAEAPAKKTAPRRRGAPAPDAATVDAAPDAQAFQETQAKAAPRRRGSRAPAPIGEAATASGSPAETPDPPAVAPPQRTRRRSPSAVDQAAAAAAPPEPPAEPPPRQRRGRAQPTPATTHDEPVAATAPPPRQARATKKASTPQPPSS
jgi:hypothetical protein